MKVKVTYTVDYDEVPRLINDMLAECRTKLRNSAEFKFDFFRLGETTEELQRVQKNLDLVVSQLEDCMNLCRGYAEAAADPGRPPVTASHMEKLRDLDDELANVPNLDGLEVKDE